MCARLIALYPLSAAGFLGVPKTLDSKVEMWIVPLRGKYLVWAITGASLFHYLSAIRTTDVNICAACCCQGFLLLGYDQGVMSGIVSA